MTHRPLPLSGVTSAPTRQASGLQRTAPGPRRCPLTSAHARPVPDRLTSAHARSARPAHLCARAPGPQLRPRVRCWRSLLRRERVT